jgi:hypothetical protein
MTISYRTALPRVAAKKPPMAAFRSGPALRPC